MRAVANQFDTSAARRDLRAPRLPVRELCTGCCSVGDVRYVRPALGPNHVGCPVLQVEGDIEGRGHSAYVRVRASDRFATISHENSALPRVILHVQSKAPDDVMLCVFDQFHELGQDDLAGGAAFQARDWGLFETKTYASDYVLGPSHRPKP